MVQRYTMRAFKTSSPTKHVYWSRLGASDLVGTYSPYDPSELSSIVVDYITELDFDPVANVSTASVAGGNLSGTYPNPTVVRINGATVPVAGSLTTGHVPVVSGVDAITYGYIANANVSASAAIAGTKISPNFGSQTVVTTGTSEGSSFIVGASGPTISKGTGVPNTSPPNGSIYLRIDGTSYTGVYTRQAGAWAVPKMDAISFNGTDVIKATSASTVTLSHTTTTESTTTYGDFVTSLVEASTTNATPANLHTWTITDEAVTAIDVIVTAIKSDGTQGAVYKRSMGFRRDGGTVNTLFTVSDDKTEEDSSGWDVTIDNSSSTGRVRITGAASTTIRWVATVRIQVTTTS